MSYANCIAIWLFFGVCHTPYPVVLFPQVEKDGLRPLNRGLNDPCGATFQGKIASLHPRLSRLSGGVCHWAYSEKLRQGKICTVQALPVCRAPPLIPSKNKNKIIYIRNQNQQGAGTSLREVVVHRRFPRVFHQAAPVGNPAAFSTPLWCGKGCGKSCGKLRANEKS